jgi:hypothetical protein
MLGAPLQIAQPSTIEDLPKLVADTPWGRVKRNTCYGTVTQRARLCQSPHLRRTVAVIWQPTW